MAGRKRLRKRGRRQMSEMLRPFKFSFERTEARFPLQIEIVIRLAALHAAVELQFQSALQMARIPENKMADAA